MRYFNILIFLVMSLSQSLWAADAPTAPAPAAAAKTPQKSLNLRELERQEMKKLAATLEQQQNGVDEIVWLKSTREPDFLALHVAEPTGHSKGVMVIFPDNQQHPDWPGLIHDIRRSIPDQGFSTLSVSLPEFSAKNPTSPDKKNKQAAARSLLEADVQDLIKERITASIAWAKQKYPGLPLVLFAKGSSVTWVAPEAFNSKPAGLMIVDGYQPPEITKTNLAELFGKSAEFLIWDVTTANDRGTLDAEKRDLFARRNSNFFYQYKNFSTIDLDGPVGIQEFQKRVRGWLLKTLLPSQIGKTPMKRRSESSAQQEEKDEPPPQPSP